MRQIILAFLLLMLACSTEAATLVSEDWEGVPVGPISTSTGGGITGPTGLALQSKGWTILCSSLPCSGEVVSMTGHTGAATNALRFRYSNSECSNDPVFGWTCAGTESALKHVFTGTTDIYERYWVRYEQIDGTAPSFGFSNSSKQHEINTSGDPEPVLEYYGESPEIMVFGTSNTSRNCPQGVSVDCLFRQNQVTHVSTTVNTWYCVEVHYGTAQVEIWIGNGVTQPQVVSYGLADGWLPSTWTNYYLYRESAKNQYRYEDEHLVSTTRVGCGASPPPDTTPPSAPTGVMVTMLAAAMLFGGFYGTLTADHIPVNRLALGHDHAHATTLRTVAVQGSADGIDAEYLVVPSNQPDRANAAVPDTDRVPLSPAVETKDAD